MAYNKEKVELNLVVLKVYREENYGGKDLQRLQLERWDQPTKKGQLKVAKRIYYEDKESGNMRHSKQTMLNRADVAYILAKGEEMLQELDGHIQPSLPSMEETPPPPTDDDIQF